MLTGEHARTLGDQLQDFVCSLEILWSLGKLRNSQRWLALLQRLSIGRWLQLQARLYGCINCLEISKLKLHLSQCCIVTTSRLFILLRILLFMSGQNISKLICILSENTSVQELLSFYLYGLITSWPTSLRSLFRHRAFDQFYPSSTSRIYSVSLEGEY